MSKWLAALLVIAFGMPLVAGAQDGSNQPAAAPVYQEGKHYVLLEQPLFSGNKDKIEVIEFFWYGCGHCYNFEPLINPWKKALPAAVEFVYSPAPWGPVRELHARAYYTAVAMGMIDTMHEVLFKTLAVQHKPLNTEDEIAALFVANGADDAKFRKVFNGFTVTGQVRQADARTRGAKVTGTPEMVVAGKYRVSATLTGSQAAMLEVASYLVDKELAAISAK